MIQLFKSKASQVTRPSEDQIRASIQMRAKINQEARRLAIQMGKEQVVKPTPKSTKIVSAGDMLQTLDAVLDAVSAYENTKITAITELYLAIESGDTKNLITFLKKKDKAIKKKKTKKIWEL